MKIEDIKNILKKKTVGIAGCGGLGSNCAVALARVGIGKLIIIDFDVVDISNLNRQYYFIEQLGQKKVFALEENLKKISPSVEIIKYDMKLKLVEIIKIFNTCDLIIEAFDLAEMKEMIIEAVLSNMPDKPLIIGNGMAGWGNNDSIKTIELNKNLYVCGDNISEISEELPPLAPRVGIVANMQANLALELLLKNQ